MSAGVYKITAKDGREYVGQSDDVTRRLLAHRAQLVRGAHCNVKLQRAWNKYGPDFFTFEQVASCSVENLNSVEQFFLDGQTSRDFNIARYAESPAKGLRHTAEAKQKIAKAKLGKKTGPISEQRKAKISAGYRAHVFRDPIAASERARFYANTRWRVQKIKQAAGMTAPSIRG